MTMPYISIIYVLLTVALIKVYINTSKYIQVNRYYEKYKRWLQGENIYLRRNHHQVIKLFKDAGIQDTIFPLVEPLGLGQIATTNVSVFNNFPNATEAMGKATIGKFEQAIGVYHSRVFDTISPLYWIETILFIPKNAFNYLGLDSESILIKIFQLIYWFVGGMLTLIYSVYTNEINAAIRAIIEKLLFM